MDDQVTESSFSRFNPFEAPDSGEVALLIAHPAHELLVHAWMCLATPTVYVLTKGAAHGLQPRIRRTGRMIESIGCKAGNIFGAINDQDLYDMLLRGDRSPLLKIVSTIAAALCESGTRSVVVDSAEGRILAHDVWRAMVDAAVFIASQNRSDPIQVIEFPIEDWSVPTDEASFHRLKLTAQEQQAKKRSIEDYVEIATEAVKLLDGPAKTTLQMELFRNGHYSKRWLSATTGKTPYEIHGEQQVKAGRYSQCIRFRQHVLPLLEELCELQQGMQCA
ncbi:MAG: hypothetical protein ABL921_06655 [Pirellula sp.]